MAFLHVAALVVHGNDFDALPALSVRTHFRIMDRRASTVSEMRVAHRT
jgi:hypothetical protein